MTGPAGKVTKTTPEQKRRAKDLRLRRLYGITIEEFEATLEKQNRACAICKKPFGQKKIHVDHDHFSGAFRGLLDYRCNSGILFFAQDDIIILQNAIEYLRSNLEAPPSTASNGSITT